MRRSEFSSLGALGIAYEAPRPPPGGELAVLGIFIELVVDQGDELGIITSHRK
jgi:hypothetical protein